MFRKLPADTFGSSPYLVSGQEFWMIDEYAIFTCEYGTLKDGSRLESVAGQIFLGIMKPATLYPH